MKSKKILFTIVLMAGVLLVLSGVSLAAGEKYTIKENLITKVELGTRAEQLLSNISISSSKVYNGDKEIAATDKIATGMLLKDENMKYYE